jgi:hypothetical protein
MDHGHNHFFMAISEFLSYFTSEKQLDEIKSSSISTDKLVESAKIQADSSTKLIDSMKKLAEQSKFQSNSIKDQVSAVNMQNSVPLENAKISRKSSEISEKQYDLQSRSNYESNRARLGFYFNTDFSKVNFSKPFQITGYSVNIGNTEALKVKII